ncbi:unnamed protein product [Clonostachys byssicola]|uniref:Uncharacterized protein n=1 Tax=Clonostachys byssicola TaxID=160290 RepID=A0A9N9YCL2_9HYPO|nr:unnamed protein product [Clonostachys byssicola]
MLSIDMFIWRKPGVTPSKVHSNVYFGGAGIKRVLEETDYDTVQGCDDDGRRDFADDMVRELPDGHGQLKIMMEELVGGTAKGGLGGREKGCRTWD